MSELYVTATEVIVVCHCNRCQRCSSMQPMSEFTSLNRCQSCSSLQQMSELYVTASKCQSCMSLQNKRARSGSGCRQHYHFSILVYAFNLPLAWGGGGGGGEVIGAEVFAGSIYIINYAGSVHNVLEVYITAISPKGSVQSSNGCNQFFNCTLTNKNGLVSKLVFYAQSTSAITSGRLRTA